MVSSVVLESIILSMLSTELVKGRQRGNRNSRNTKSYERKRVRQCQVMNKSGFAGKSFVTSEAIYFFDIDNDNPY